MVFYSWADLEELPPFDRLAAAKQAHAQYKSATWIRELGDMSVGVIVDEVGSAKTPTILRLLRLRGADDRPHSIGLQTEPHPVVLPEDEHLTDWTQVVLWPDGFVAHDPHRDAPSLARLGRYFSRVCEQHVRFAPRYDRELAERLNRLHRLRGVSVKISTSEAQNIENTRRYGMFGRLVLAGREAESASIVTELSAGRKRDTQLDPELRSAGERLFEEQATVLDQLVMRGFDDNGKSVVVDFLKERVQGDRNVARSSRDTRQPERQAMYEAIIALRIELDARGVLERSTTGELA